MNDRQGITYPSSNDGEGCASATSAAAADWVGTKILSKSFPIGASVASESSINLFHAQQQDHPANVHTNKQP